MKLKCCTVTVKITKIEIKYIVKINQKLSKIEIKYIVW